MKLGQYRTVQQWRWSFPVSCQWFAPIRYERKRTAVFNLVEIYMVDFTSPGPGTCTCTCTWYCTVLSKCALKKKQLSCRGVHPIQYCTQQATRLVQFALKVLYQFALKVPAPYKTTVPTGSFTVRYWYCAFAVQVPGTHVSRSCAVKAPPLPSSVCLTSYHLKIFHNKK
jgi:hypothetical protein